MSVVGCPPLLLPLPLAPAPVVPALPCASLPPSAVLGEAAGGAGEAEGVGRSWSGALALVAEGSSPGT